MSADVGFDNVQCTPQRYALAWLKRIYKIKRLIYGGSAVPVLCAGCIYQIPVNMYNNEVGTLEIIERTCPPVAPQP